MIWIALAACVAGGIIAFLLFGRSKAPAYTPLLVAPSAVAAPTAPADVRTPTAEAAPAIATVNVQDLPPAPPEDES